MENAWKADMISRGGGGDFPRNVMATSLSGVSKDETFDVLPYAEAVGQYLMHFIKAVKFPRKLKVCFSNSEDNETHATFRDMGFVAKGNGTFDIYIAGGLGNNPKLGVLAATNVIPAKILYYIKAMVNTFTTYGNYENRGRARTRYLQDTLGADGLKSAFNEKLKEITDSEQLDLTLPLPIFLTKKGTGTAPENSRIIPQKQDGLYAVYYHPVGGYLDPKKICELADAVSDMNHVEIRLTPQGGLYVINCNADEAAKIIELTPCNASSIFETSTACVGASICQTGLGNSPALLHACAKAVHEANLPADALPKIRISGCPSSCGGHQIAAIGFRGAIKQTADGPKPAFAIFEGGSDKQAREILADTGKAITVEDIPAFLVELGKMVADTGKNYHEWIKENHGKLVALTEKYTA
jgi:ferredoxin-nitrite reductase